MKKLVFILLILMAATTFAQNLQVHYDLGEDRNYFTSTLEMFKPDEYGATFFFVDMDYNAVGNKSMSLGYWEIARYINLPKVDKLQATVQYNDGVIIGDARPAGYWGAPLNNVWLAGVSYPINLGFITINTDVLYRQMYDSDAPDFQLTFVWFKPFFDGKVVFTGFADVWTQDILGEKKNVFLSEPQVWYNASKHLAVGGEVELSKNFIPFEEDFKIMPTLGMKWTF